MNKIQANEKIESTARVAKSMCDQRLKLVTEMDRTPNDRAALGEQCCAEAGFARAKG
jgi:hypothetical protein